MHHANPRILIIRLSALGDIIHALPLLHALRTKFPEAHLGWLVEPAGAALLKDHPLLDALHIFPRKACRENLWAALRGPLPGLLHELREQHYETAIDVQGLTKSSAWGWLAGIPRRIGFRGIESRELSGWLATQRVRPSADKLHVVERNLTLLAPLGIAAPAPEDVVFPLYLPAGARQKANEILAGAGKGRGEEESAATPLVIVNPGAGWASKRWPAQRFGQLARLLVERFAARVAVSWGPGEEPLVRQVLDAAEAPVNAKRKVDFQAAVVPATPGCHPLPSTTLMELGAVISRAGLFVGGDTGPTHLAAALGVPTVSMMGPLDARRNGPFGAHCLTIQHAIPRKAPFWQNHRRWCDPRADLSRVTVEEVFAACARML